MGFEIGRKLHSNLSEGPNSPVDCLLAKAATGGNPISSSRKRQVQACRFLFYIGFVGSTLKDSFSRIRYVLKETYRIFVFVTTKAVIIKKRTRNINNYPSLFYRYVTYLLNFKNAFKSTVF